MVERPGPGYYDRLYQSRDRVFGTEPVPMVQKLLELKESGKVLDLGAGEGRNSLFLAEHGFSVVSVDNAAVGIEKLRRFAEEKGVRVDSRVEDLRTSEVPPGQDIIIAVAVFHYFLPEEAIATIQKMKTATNAGGIHVLSVVTRDSDFYRRVPENNLYFPEPDDVKALYSDWKIIESGLRRWEAFPRDPQGEPVMNVSLDLMVKKPQ